MRSLISPSFLDQVAAEKIKSCRLELQAVRREAKGPFLANDLTIGQSCTKAVVPDHQQISGNVNRKKRIFSILFSSIDVHSCDAALIYGILEAGIRRSGLQVTRRILSPPASLS
jgi:hypothetical protein